jgi:GMP reductase
MRIEDEVKLDFSDVLIRPKRSTLVSRKEAVLTRKFKFKWTDETWEGIPIIASNMDHTGTIQMANAISKYQMLTALCKFEEFPDHTGLHYLMRTIGLEDDLDFDSPKWLCIDVANGYTERFYNYVEHARKKHEKSIIIAGNVCTPEATEQMLLVGADVVKIGIGPGSVCTTRKMTGVGYPQLSATIECADAAHGLSGHIITDGGCTVVGDIAKSFGAGADFVMLGGMLAGHDECKGEFIAKKGAMKTAKMEFYGMSSEEAQVKYYGEKRKHAASEGKLVQVDHKGTVNDTVQEILGGLRSACTYAGAKEIKDLPKTTTFIRVSRQLNDVYS